MNVGDYVNYIPDLNESGYKADKLTENITGSDRNISTISQEELKWKILNIHEDGTVDLISETKTNGRIYFTGALGYNNGVYILNDICKELYSNNTLGIEARNINIEDIENQMNQKGILSRDEYIQAIKYGEHRTFEDGYNHYPNLYAYENGSGINTTIIKINGINKSENGYSNPTEYTSSTADEELTVTQTYYNFTNPSECFDNSKVYDMLFNQGNYWVASRYAYCVGEYAGFGLRTIGNSNINGGGMFISDGTPYSSNYCFRPIVSLGNDIQIIPVENADGSDKNHMHKIMKDN